jgi:hypothetical protein
VNLIEAANQVCGENSRTGFVETQSGCGRCRNRLI